MTENKLKLLDARAVKACIAALEDLFLDADLNMEWIDSSFRTHEAQLVDVAIATLARYGNTVLLPDVFVAEELDHGNHEDARLMRAMTEIYAIWVDKEAIVAREDNLLNPPNMTSPHWKVMFNYEFAKLMVAKGRAMAFYQSNYGWEDFYGHEAKANRVSRIIGVFNLREDHWGEFNGTFATGEDTRTGFTANVMYSNGIFRDLRYEGSLGDIMKELG